MKVEELAMIINEIDEDMVEDAWTENGMTIIISESPLSFWKVAVTTAACFAAVIAGVFCYTRLKPDDISLPGESVYTSQDESSESESTVRSEPESTESSDPLDELHDQEQNFLNPLPKECEENRILFDETNSDTKYYAEKFNNRSYAQLNIEETNATEDRPVYITIYKLALDNRDPDFTANIDRISETFVLTGPGEFSIEYSCARGEGSISCLYIECSDYDGYDGLVLSGNWIP